MSIADLAWAKIVVGDVYLMQYSNATFFVRVSFPCRGSPKPELTGFPKDSELLLIETVW
jgi:hypothetical protein